MTTIEPSGRIFQLNISPGGVPKTPVNEVLLTEDGLLGDWQRNRRYHGGPDRAVCLYALEAILTLQAEGHPTYPGSLGENITLVGIDLTALAPGTFLALGDEAVIEITADAPPCKTIAGSFANGKSRRVSRKRDPAMSRLYARVRRGGMLRVAMSVRVVRDPEATL